MAKILLIDDSPDLRALVCLLLEQGGHHVIEADRGADGLRLARTERPELVLTDLALPDLSGWDVIRALKADPATAAIPVVALTAHAMRSDQERALELGGDGFIAKPIDDERFEAMVRSMLRTPRPTPRSGAPKSRLAPEPREGRPGLSPGRAPAASPARRILVVDDHADVLALIGHYVETAGFQVFTATDGPSALAAAERDRPDLVVLDVMLPGMDGYEVTARLKARPTEAYLPVVLVTAGPVDRERGLAVGADDFLSKPIDRSELQARVRALLRLRDAVEEARRKAEVLRALDQAKQRFIAGVAHDLRNPLNAMALTIQMLRIEPPGPADLDEALGVLVKNVDQMNDLVTALLDYSKLVSGRIPVQLGPFDPRQLLGEVHDSLAATAAHRGLELGLEIDEGLPAEVVSDYAKCRQVVFNLASNALKFTPAGSVILRGRPDEPGRWAVEVADTGVGIAAEEAELIFEEFGQAQIGRPADAPGTGLGLTICRRLVELLGGRLSVRSELGRGSTFTATWPIRVVADSASH